MSSLSPCRPKNYPSFCQFFSFYQTANAIYLLATHVQNGNSVPPLMRDFYSVTRVKWHCDNYNLK